MHVRGPTQWYQDPRPTRALSDSFLQGLLYRITAPRNYAAPLDNYAAAPDNYAAATDNQTAAADDSNSSKRPSQTTAPANFLVAEQLLEGECEVRLHCSTERINHPARSTYTPESSDSAAALQVAHISHTQQVFIRHCQHTRHCCYVASVHQSTSASGTQNKVLKLTEQRHAAVNSVPVPAAVSPVPVPAAFDSVLRGLGCAHTVSRPRRKPSPSPSSLCTPQALRGCRTSGCLVQQVCKNECSVQTTVLIQRRPIVSRHCATHEGALLRGSALKMIAAHVCCSHCTGEGTDMHEAHIVQM